jgi:hypothetical protein
MIFVMPNHEEFHSRTVCSTPLLSSSNRSRQRKESLWVMSDEQTDLWAGTRFPTEQSDQGGGRWPLISRGGLASQHFRRNEGAYSPSHTG